MTMDVFSFVIVGVYVLGGGLVLSLLVLGLMSLSSSLCLGLIYKYGFIRSG